MNSREIYMAMVKGKKPERFLNQYEPFAFVLMDPMLANAIGGRKEGYDLPDAWGTMIRWKQGDHAAMPYITEENKVCPDICNWRKFVKSPSIDFPKEAWKAAEDYAASIDRKEKLVTAFMATGLFEQSHFLMGFEDTLMNLLTEPEAMHELLDYILKWKLAYAKNLIDHLNPDVIFSHDDWGAKDRLFMSADTFREFFKPRYEKLYGYIVSRGVQVVHHADSYCANIIEDMIDMHITTWQGIIPDNDIKNLQKQLDGRLILMGGIDGGVFDFEAWNEDQIRKEVRRACQDILSARGFIPCITYGLPESIYPGVFEIIEDEIYKINANS